MSRKDEICAATKLLIPREQFFAEIDQLISQIDSLGNLGPDDPIFEQWRKAVEALLIHSLGEKSKQTSDFGWIGYRPSIYEMDDEYGIYGIAKQREYESFHKGLKDAKILLKGIREEVQKYFPDDVVKSKTKTDAKGISNRIFVIHGHDHELLYKVKDFLRKIHMEPIVLRDLPNLGRTIIEKFESYADVGYAIALLTSDDKVIADDEKRSVEYRARQNVILELGYFMGKLGRSRVAVLCDKNVARPGDIDGMVYTITESDGDWQFGLAKELKASGLNIDMNLMF